MEARAHMQWASLFRRFTNAEVCGTGSVKYGKLATKVPWIYRYFTVYIQTTSPRGNTDAASGHVA